MTEEASILNAAKYLRNVRPIDPEEIYEYVDSRPHPAVVRRTLREQAVELGIYEREDGTFIPVEPGPVKPEFDGIDQFPETYAGRLEDLLIERYGPNWYRDESGDWLRERLDEMKQSYFADETVTYDAETALAYAIYHLPDYYAAVQYTLDPLGRAGLLDRRLRVLDIGAGAGGPALGLHDYFPKGTLIEYNAVEPSAAADVLESMLEMTRQNFHTTVQRETAEAFEPDGEYDLLLFANVLSELESPVETVERYLDHLAPHGTVVAIAPAEERTATRLREFERELCDRCGDLTVFAPTVRIWPDGSPSDHGWTFTRQPDIEPPSFQRRLDSAGVGDGTYTKSDVQFAYLLLRTDSRQVVEYEPNPDKLARMADSEAHVTDRIDLVGLKLSPDLADDGKPLFKISDSTETVDHYAVLANRTALNGALEAAPYGALLRFENALVLWNDDEEAYNLVVDDEAVVDRIG